VTHYYSHLSVVAMQLEPGATLRVPRNTSAKIIDTLNKEVNAALDDPKMNARLADLGGVALPGSPVEFGKLIAEETEKWAKVVKFSGAKAD
jgi:tripartite-type tricarboxylate transporter receptor subunit TctC